MRTLSRPAARTRTRSSLALLTLTAALALPFPNSALAGPVELLAQVALHPTDPNAIVLRYVEGGHGIIYSRDAGESWRLMCRSAIDSDVPRSGPIALTADGHVMMGVFQGLFVDDGKGCGWTQNDFIGDAWVTDFALHPSDPAITFTATSNTERDAENRVIQRDAEGGFSDVGEPEKLLVTQLRVVEGDEGLRFYERVLKGTDYLLRYSDDGRETFTEVPFSSADGNLSLLAVDPSNPDRVVALLERTPQDDEILVSDDRGATFRVYMTMSQFGAIQFLPSGKVYLGEAGSVIDPSVAAGLWVAGSLDEAPEKLAEYPVACLGYQPANDTLFACQYRTFGKVDQDSGEYTQLFHFQDVDGFVKCEGENVAAACEEQLCVDYCTFGHFARAPVCNAYTRPDQACGPCAAMVDQGADISVCYPRDDAGTAGTTDGTAGTTATPDAGAPPPADGGEPDGGVPAGRGGDSGVCNCSSVGAGAGRVAVPLVLGSMIGAALFLRRRRIRFS